MSYTHSQHYIIGRFYTAGMACTAIRRRGVRPPQYLATDNVLQTYSWVDATESYSVFRHDFVAQGMIEDHGWQETHEAVPDPSGYTSLSDFREAYQNHVHKLARVVIEHLGSLGYPAPSMRQVMMSFYSHTDPAIQQVQYDHRKLLRWHAEMLANIYQGASKLTGSQKQRLILASERKIVESQREIFSLLSEEWLDKYIVADEAGWELLSEGPQTRDARRQMAQMSLRRGRVLGQEDGIMGTDTFLHQEFGNMALLMDQEDGTMADRFLDSSDEDKHLDTAPDPPAGLTEECIICYDAEPEYMYKPCMHAVACSSCALEFRKRSATCPWCRCELEDEVT